MTAFREKAMLATLHTAAWSARKHDKKVSQEVADNHKTDSDVGRYNKVLIAKDKLKAIQKAITDARVHHYENTMPWDNFGTRLLPVKNYVAYTDAQRGFRERFDVVVREFCDGYETYVDDAKQRLGSLFNREDYPPPVVIRHKFRMEVVLLPMPDESDFRVDLNDAEIAKIRDDVAKTIESRITAASQDLWQRLYTTVKHLHERLVAFDGGKTNRLHATIIGNLVELTDMLGALNFSDDPDLERMRNEIASTLCTHDIEALRTGEQLRKDQAVAAEAILTKMQDYIGGAS